MTCLAAKTTGRAGDSENYSTPPDQSDSKSSVHGKDQKFKEKDILSYCFITLCFIISLVSIHRSYAQNENFHITRWRKAKHFAY